MIEFPNCKINLGLWVTQRRTDGYHNIQTVMYPVPWCDMLEILPSHGLETNLVTTGNSVDGSMQENLCYRAWRLFSVAFGIPAVDIHLHKVIPAGAGLGGGSSDGSFALRMLNSMFQLKLTNDDLRMFAVQLGMDCPFFIENQPALSTGRGEYLKPISLTLDGFYILLVKPPVHVSTAAAFIGIKPVFRENFIDELTVSQPESWRKTLTNDFEESVFNLYPEIQEIKNMMYRHGAVYASLSGSGSAVYGLFAENPPEINFPDCIVYKTLLGSQF